MRNRTRLTASALVPLGVFAELLTGYTGIITHNSTFMMNYGFMGGGGYGGLLSSVNEIVWLAVGILLIVWLWSQVKK